jgi:hypothetical protein
VAASTVAVQDLRLQVRPVLRQPIAGLLRAVVPGLHHGDGGDPGPGLQVRRVLQDHGVQVGLRGVEVMAELPQHGARHAQVGRRCRVVPPRCQRALRIACKPGVTVRRQLCQQVGHHLGGQIGTSRLTAQLASPLGAFTLHGAVGRRRQPQQHLLVVPWRERCRLRDGGR